ncbi:hypothetical protein FQR65_LT20180 [Abscondita terminalis]|nr:hypothetical protein FQR65_LT20180 [Abscondita terminalis]
MRVVHTEAALINAVQMTKAEAGAAFGNPAVYMEKFLQNRAMWTNPDPGGLKPPNAVYLGERDCSMQRRHQKVIEEAPGSPAFHAAWSRRMRPSAARSLQKLGLTAGAGTSSSCRAPGDRVDHGRGRGAHPDRGRGRREAAFHPAPDQCPTQGPCHRVPRGTPRIRTTHAPSPGPASRMWHASPGGPGVRVDSHVYNNYFVPPNYDSMIGKIIVHGDTREQALARMRTALLETVVEGIKTNIPLHQDLMVDAKFMEGGTNIHYLEEWLAHRSGNKR